MTLIYHGTPISPIAALESLGPRAFCISFFRTDDAERCEAVSPAVMYDCGAYSFFTAARRSGREQNDQHSWRPYYEWLEPRLFQPGRWAIVPDVIDAGTQLQDALLAEWPFGHRGAPVWHTDEPLDRLLRLIDQWPRVCMGSTGEHWQVGGPDWTRRMDETWSRLERLAVRPAIHMLRGVAVAHLYPFDSADSSSLGQNGHRYRQPLFAGTPDEWTGLNAYADRLERRARGLLRHRHPTKNEGPTRVPTRAGPETLVKGAPMRLLLPLSHGGNS